MATNRQPFTITTSGFEYPSGPETELIFGSDFAHSEFVIPMARFKFYDATGADSNAPSIYIRLGGTFSTQLSNGYGEATGVFGSVTPGEKINATLGGMTDLLGKIKGSGLEAIQKGLMNSLGVGIGFIGSAGQNPKAQVEFLTRKLFNSFQQLIYQGPRFRSFQLPFNMKPTSYEEAKRMRDIIHTFRVASSPRGNLNDSLVPFSENALAESGKTPAEIEKIMALPDEEKKIALTELGLESFNEKEGSAIVDASGAPLTFGYPDMCELELILYKKNGTNSEIVSLFISDYCMIENVGLDYGAQNKMVFLSNPESAKANGLDEVGDYFPSEVNMTIALRESVLITADYATAEHKTIGRTIF
jgi:hypothetical protein